MRSAVLTLIVISAATAQDCQRTHIFSFMERLQPIDVMEPPWDEHLAAVIEHGLPQQSEAFAKIKNSNLFILLIEGFMIIEGPNATTSYYHLMGKTKGVFDNRAVHFFYKKSPIQRVTLTEFRNQAQLCKIKRPAMRSFRFQGRFAQ
ncbi:unnamed protein product [Cylicocyclus nassatus]|uniref:Uncharacterized protein n=1 Tax=Cylicocyclus nassatus TaxID=53992 RepID=A0AA36DTI4_CYLNA|nr:unnamed protein product [Cylicocyclus nassatus]